MAEQPLTDHREDLIEAYLLGIVSREAVLRELGSSELEAIELQRDALRRDVEWGLRSRLFEPL